MIKGTAYSREAAVHHFLPIVKYVAGKLLARLPKHMDANDLIHDGVVGLIDALEKYDDAREVKFETYAIPRIYGAMLDSLRSQDWVPRGVRAKAREIDRARTQLEIELGRAVTADELADKLGWSFEEYNKTSALISNTAVASIDDPIRVKDLTIPLHEAIVDPNIHVGQDVERRAMERLLFDHIDDLPTQEQTVISLYYLDEYNLREIAQAIGVSESRVSQVHRAALTHLREGLEPVRI